jgi:hypothetical protein
MKIDEIKGKKSLILVILLEIFLIFLITKGFLFLPLAFILILIFFFLTFLSIERTFYLLAGYMLIFDLKEYLYNYPGLNIYYTQKIAFPIFLFIIFYSLLYLLLYPNKIKEINISSFDLAMLFFMGSILISFIIGLSKNYPQRYWRYELIHFMYYLIYFVFVNFYPKEKTLKFFDIIVFFICVGCLFDVYSLIARKTFFGFFRVFTEKVNMTIMALPYILFSYLYPATFKKRIIMSIGLFFLIISMLSSLQRALWGSAMLIVLIWLFMFLQIYKKYIKIALIIFFSLFVGSLITIFIIEKLTPGGFIETIIWRMEVILNPFSIFKDASWIIRWGEIKSALRPLFQNFENLLFGEGLGATTWSRWRFILKDTLDNSFAYLLWKAGLAGLISFLTLIILFFKRCIKLLKINEPEIKIITLTAILSYTGMLIISMTNSGLLSYRFNLIWGALFGIIEILYRNKIKKEN